MTLVTRTAGDPSAIVGVDPQQVVTSMDPELPFFAVKPMQQRVDESLVSRRTPMMLASLFGGIALFLAAVGIYGVLAYQVAQRRKEIGIRMALGSDGRRIFGLIVSEGLWLLALGVAVGLGRRLRDPARHGDAALRRAADGSRPCSRSVDGGARRRRVPRLRRPGAPRVAHRSADRVDGHALTFRYRQDQELRRSSS